MKSYYFSHDYNANMDVKILFLRQQLGMEGYGIYWFIIESLASAGGKLPLKILPVLALQMQTSEVKVSAVIKEFELFHIEDEQFFSIRLKNNIDNLNKISEINSIKGKKSAEKRKLINLSIEPRLNSGSTMDEPRSNNGSTNKIKENKIKENKEEKDKKEENGQFGIWNTNPLPENVGKLPEAKIQASIEQTKITRQIDVTWDEIEKMYEIFKIQNLTGKKYYGCEEDVHKHFTYWLNYQKFDAVKKNKIHAKKINRDDSW